MKPFCPSAGLRETDITDKADKRRFVSVMSVNIVRNGVKIRYFLLKMRKKIKKIQFFIKKNVKTLVILKKNSIFAD